LLPPNSETTQRALTVLTAKQGVLHKQLEEQSKKVKAAEDALKKMPKMALIPLPLRIRR
jgi:hypothetical protein